MLDVSKYGAPRGARKHRTPRGLPPSHAGCLLPRLVNDRQASPPAWLTSYIQHPTSYIKQPGQFRTQCPGDISTSSGV